MTLLVLLLLALVVAIAIGALVQSSRRRDGVASFRRQIDALSPEARRPVVDQVQNAAERRGEVTDDESRDDDDGDEGSARGT